MAYTYSKIASYTVGSGGISTVNFLAIPQNYTDLILKTSINNTSGLDATVLQFNGSTTGYTYKTLRGSGAAGASYDQSSAGFSNGIWSGYRGINTSTFSNDEIYIPNYTSSNYKSVSIDATQEANTTTAYSLFTAGLWSNTAAINSITISASGSSLAYQYSTFTLYGIKAEV